MTDKGRILTFPDTTAIEAEAAAWVARFDAGGVSAHDQAVFQEWLNRSALHRQAIAEYGNLWSEFDTLRLLTDAEDAASSVPDTHPVLLERAKPWLAACAAAVVALAGGAVFLHPQPRQVAKAENPAGLVTPPTRVSYETAVGGQRRIALADGSSVILNTNSRLDVNFSGKCRDVHLLRGEAYFEVVHDKSRPFTVYASNYVVRDIGTAFDVHLSKTGLVEVGVTKGSVEVAVAHGGRASGTTKNWGVVVAGHGITLGQDIAAGPNIAVSQEIERTRIVSKADMGRKLAWRQGELIYTGQPLSEVLADVSRYSDIKIELADPALESLPVGGAFRTDQITAIFAALENNFGVHAEWIDPQHVRFTASREKPASKD